jgi:hypothetical protein
MSIILRKIIVIVCFTNFCISFSQEIKKQEPTTVFVELKDKKIATYAINKDTTIAQFNFYLKGYETKSARDEGVKKYKNVYPSPGKPSFICFFYSSSSFSLDPKKPQKLKTLEGMKYISLKQFQTNNYESTRSIFIIHKLKDGTYLKWEMYRLSEE